MLVIGRVLAAADHQTRVPPTNTPPPEEAEPCRPRRTRSVEYFLRPPDALRRRPPEPPLCNCRRCASVSRVSWARVSMPILYMSRATLSRPADAGIERPAYPARHAATCRRWSAAGMLECGSTCMLEAMSVRPRVGGPRARVRPVPARRMTKLITTRGCGHVCGRGQCCGSGRARRMPCGSGRARRMPCGCHCDYRCAGGRGPNCAGGGSEPSCPWPHPRGARSCQPRTCPVALRLLRLPVADPRSPHAKRACLSGPRSWSCRRRRCRHCPGRPRRIA